MLWSVSVLRRLGKTMWPSYDVILLSMRGQMDEKLTSVCVFAVAKIKKAVFEKR